MNSLAPPNLVKKPNTAGSLPVWRAKRSSDVPPVDAVEDLAGGGGQQSASAAAGGARADEHGGARRRARGAWADASAAPRTAAVGSRAHERRTAPGPDGGCAAGGASRAEYVAYHDEEWGRPVRDDRGAVRAAVPGGVPVRALVADDPAQARGVPGRFAGFEPEARGRVRRRGRGAADGRRGDRAQPGEDRRGDRQRAGGRRGRVERVAGELLWSFAPGDRPAPRTMADVPAVTPESTAMAKELKRRGFRFVGPTTAYALMQACGLVNDHLEGCLAR